MIFIILVVSALLVFIINLIWDNFEYKIRDMLETIQNIFAITLGISILVITLLLLFYPYGIEDKLKMYEGENNQIETKVKETVQAYMDYEKETYNDLVDNASIEVLLVKYPELNSNELVKEQINIYSSNSIKIKELKETQIIKKYFDFWLFLKNY